MPPHDAQTRSPVCSNAMGSGPPRPYSECGLHFSRRWSALGGSLGIRFFRRNQTVVLMNWTAGQSMRPNLSALLRLAVAAAPLFLQKDIQKGVVHPNLSVVVFDEA